MSGGGSGGGSSTTVQKADPWSGVQPYLLDAYGQLSGLYQPGQGPAYYPNQTVATPSNQENMGQNATLGNLGNMQGLADQGASNVTDLSNAAGRALGWGEQSMASSGSSIGGLAGQTANGAGVAGSAMNQLLGAGGQAAAGTGGQINAMNQLAAAGDPSTNPYFQQALQSAIRPVTEQYQEQVIPGIRQGAQDAGQMGGSRQGVAEGIAARGYQNTVGDISANMGNAAYAQGLNALQASGQLGQGLTNQGLSALGSAGSLGANQAALAGNLYQGINNNALSLYGSGMAGLGAASQLVPGQIQSQALPGQIQQGIGQQQTADQQALINSDMARYNYNQNLPYSMISDYLQLLNGAQGGQTTANQQQTGGGSSRLTGALGGAATGAAIGSVVPGIGTAIGAGVGGLYGLLA